MTGRWVGAEGTWGAAAGRTSPSGALWGLAWRAEIVLDGHPEQRLGDPWFSHSEDQAEGKGLGSLPRCFRVVASWAACAAPPSRAEG